MALQPSNTFDPSRRIDFVFKRIDAYDPDTCAYLRESRGRSRGAPQWWLYYADAKDAEGNYRPYKEWRHSFHAWSLGEALQHANQKLQKMVTKGIPVGRSKPYGD
jgi:hypothetical protein